MLMVVVCLDGCGYFTYLPYFSGSATMGGRGYWSKKGLGDEEVSRFYRKCYSRLVEIYKNRSSMDLNLNIEIEIEGQTCMLEHGFTFKDAPYPHEKLCSSSYIKARDMKSYMIFPACQSKYGKYRK